MAWDLSAANPLLEPEGDDEGINASDAAIVEFEGKTYIYYSLGDQLTWMNTKRALFPGPMDEFFRTHF